MSVHFADETALVEALLQLLQREQASLVEMNIERVEALLDDKGRLLKQLNDCAQARYLELAAQGLEASERGMASWLARQPQAVQQAWGRLHVLLEQTRETNRLNGLLLENHLSRTRQSLQVLQGQAAGAQLYGRDGQASPAARSHSLTQV